MDSPFQRHKISRYSIRCFLILTAIIIGMPLDGRHFAFADATSADPVAATQKGADWIISQVPNWLPANAPKHFTCFMCHMPGEILLGTSVAAERGYQVKASDFKQMIGILNSYERPSGFDAGAIADTQSPLSPPTDFTSPSYSVADTTGRAAMGLAGYLGFLSDAFAAPLSPQDDGTANSLAQGVVNWALAHQTSSGYWPTASESVSNHEDFTETASFVLLLAYWKNHSPPNPNLSNALTKADAWLIGQSPPNARDAALRVLALTLAGDGAATQMASDLLSMQSASNGGWPDVPNGASGAWATGMAIYALSKLDSTGYYDAIMRGRNFLLLPGNQRSDGYWLSYASVGALTSVTSDHPAETVIALEPTAWAIAALSLKTTPPCDLSLQPQSAEIFSGPNHTLQFQASPRTACFGDAEFSLASADGSPIPGSIDPSTGLYAAPDDLSQAANLIVRVTINGESNRFATTTLRVKPRVRVSLTASADPPQVDLGRTLNFAAQVTGLDTTDDHGVLWSTQESGSQAGSVVNGVYAAPDRASTPATVHVIAASAADTTASTTVAVTLKTPVVAIHQPTITPDGYAPLIYNGDSLQFAATASNPKDSTINWSVIGDAGTIDANGLFQATPPVSLPTVVTVRAASDADPTKHADAKVTINPKIKLSVSPTNSNGDTLKITKGAQIAFTALVRYSPIANPSVTWSLLINGTTQALPSDQPLSLNFTAPDVDQNAPATLIATSVEDPRVTFGVNLMILTQIGFVDVINNSGYPGDTVQMVVEARTLDENATGGVIRLKYDHTYLNSIIDQVTLDPRIDAQSVAVSDADNGDGTTTLTATFSSKSFTGSGPLMVVPLMIFDKAPPGEIMLNGSAEFKNDAGQTSTAGSGSGSLTVLPIVTNVSVNDATAMPGELVFFNLYVDRNLDVTDGLAGIAVEEDPDLPDLIVDHSIADNPKNIAGSALPQSTSFDSIQLQPPDGTTLYSYYFYGPTIVNTPGVIMNYPLRIPNNAKRGMQYKIDPYLVLDHYNYQLAYKSGFLTIKQPVISISPSTASVRTGETISIAVVTQDLEDSDVTWKILPDTPTALAQWFDSPFGAGTISHQSGLNFTYQAPAVVPAENGVILRAYSSQYPDTVFATLEVKILPPLSLSLSAKSLVLPVGGSVIITATPSETGHTLNWNILPDSANATYGSVKSTSATTAIYQAIAPVSGTPKDVQIRAAMSDHPQTTATIHLTLQPVRLSLATSVLTVSEGDIKTVQATVTGGTTNLLDWKPTDSAPASLWGSTPQGALTIFAPSPLAAPATYHFQAVSREDPAQTAALEVWLTQKAKLTLAPTQITLLTGGSADFTASVASGSAPSGIVWTVTPQLGSLTPDSAHPLIAHYVAPATVSPSPQTLTVQVASADDPTVFATATVTIESVSLSVALAQATVALGGSQAFAATVSGTANVAVKWSLNGPGSLSADGMYQAPSQLSGTPGRATVTAISQEDPRQSAVATIAIPAVVVQMGVAPASLPVEGTAKLTAKVLNAADASVVWSVAGGDANGKIASDGSYVAPSAPPAGGSVQIVATSHADPTKSATATITIAPVTLTPTPAEVQVPLGGQSRLSATATGLTNPVILWTLADGPGSVTADGLYAAPAAGATPATAHAKATLAAPSRSAVVTIDLPAVAVSVSPTTKTLKPGDALPFAATVTNAKDTRVQWDFVGAKIGTLSAEGIYAAPSVTSDTIVKIRATSVADSTKSATASLTILAPTAVSVSIAPTSATLNLGGSQTFAATVTGGATSGVKWTLQGAGTIDAQGVYRAPDVGTTPMTAQVTATALSDGKTSASATVTIRGVGVSISPTSDQAQPGESISFAASVVNATNGGVTWSASGGAKITSNGVFTVPSDAEILSSYQVTATSVADPTKSAVAQVIIEASPSAVAITPWPMDRHDIYRTGRSDAPGPGPNAPSILWSQTAAESESANPVIDASGNLYIGTRSESMISLKSDGSVRWSLAQTLQDKGWMRSTPAVNQDGTLYLLSPSDVLYAIRSDGSAAWNIALTPPDDPSSGGSAAGPLLSSDGSIYVGLGRVVVAVEPNGSVRWKITLSPGGSVVSSSPAMAKDGRVLIGSGDGALYAIDPKTGSATPLIQTLGGIDATPAVDPDDGTIYIGSEDGELYAISPSGTLLWKARTPGPVYLTATLGANGSVLLPGSDGTLYAYRNGSVAWKYASSASIETPVATDAYGRVYAVDSGGTALALTSSGKLLWSFALPGAATSAPVIGGAGLIYLSAKDHGLLALGDPNDAVTPGDLNGDGQVSISDVTIALQFAVGIAQPTTTQIEAGDVAPKPGTGGKTYGDGKIAVSDVTRILRRVVGLELNPWP